MSDPTNCADTRSAISSPDLAGGPSLWRLPDGRMAGPSGLVAALASLSARQVKELGLQTSGISGLRGNTSSRSATLQQSLESKLQARLTGSDLCAVIWKTWATPWGSTISRPRAQVRTIDATDCGLWQTPVADDSVNRVKGKYNSRGEPKLSAQVMLAMWPTPHANCHTGAGTSGRQGGENTQMQVHGSLDKTEKRGALNPQFVCWLMGYPQEWVSCAPSVMPSTRARPQRSSAPTSKPED